MLCWRLFCTIHKMLKVYSLLMESHIRWQEPSQENKQSRVGSGGLVPVTSALVESHSSSRFPYSGLNSCIPVSFMRAVCITRRVEKMAASLKVPSRQAKALRNAGGRMCETQGCMGMLEKTCWAVLGNHFREWVQDQSISPFSSFGPLSHSEHMTF